MNSGAGTTPVTKLGPIYLAQAMGGSCVVTELLRTINMSNASSVRDLRSTTEDHKAENPESVNPPCLPLSHDRFLGTLRITNWRETK